MQRSQVSTNPDDGSFQRLSPKGLPMKVGEELEFRLTPQAELLFRLQALERAILRVPFLGQDYAAELRRAGLEKLDLTRRYYSGE